MSPRHPVQQSLRALSRLALSLVLLCPVLLIHLLTPSLTSAADEGRGVEIRQRIGLTRGSDQGVPVAGQLSMTAGGVAVSGDTLYAPTGAQVTVHAAATPGGCESFIQWQATGGSPSIGMGATFQTTFSTPGNWMVRAVCGESADSVHVLAYRVTLTELGFDWKPGDASEGADIRKNRTTDVVKPEWVPGVRNEPAAFVRSKKPRVRARLTVEPPTITRVTISGQAPAPWGGFGEKVVNFVGGLSVPDTLTFLLAGMTPSAVSRDTLAIDWFVSRPNGLDSDPVALTTSGPHPFYTLLGSPQAPMAEPWTELLWYACDFARGSTTEEEIVENLVMNVYWDSNLIYNPSYYYSSGYSSMNLTQFLYDISHASFVYLDCRDCSHWAHMQANALGMNGQYNTLGYSFLTNYVRDMGRDYWHQWSFNFHQVGFFWSEKVADMCAAADGDGIPWSPPHTEFFSTGNVTLPEYLDLFTENPSVHSVGTGICNPY